MNNPKEKVTVTLLLGILSTVALVDVCFLRESAIGAILLQKLLIKLCSDHR